MMPKTLWAVMVVATAWELGCAASVPQPNDPWAAAQADVGRAEAGGALGVPEAKLHLELAQEDLQQAKALMGENNERATSLCAVAATEAQLAFSLAKQTKAQEDARSAAAELQKGGGK
jgi:hypothetical protein